MTITKREILFSIVIVCIMFVFGFLISDSINESIMDKQQVYNTALQINNDTGLFEYGMRTDVGNAFVYGELKAIDTVTYPEIGGEYMYIEKVKEIYTMHTRTVTYTVNGHTRTRTETYWTWDRVGSEDKKCEEVSFCGVTFDSDKFIIPSTHYIDTIKESSHVRYKYYGTDIIHTGTIFTELKDDTISDNANLYKDQTIEETIESLKTGWELVVFWIFWIILIIALVIGFYYIDNNWLEDKVKRY